VFFHNKAKKLQLLRFCIIGLGNTTVDFIAFFLLTWGGVPRLLAQVCSYSVGVVNSFLFNRKWTFQVTHKTNMMEVLKFSFINGIALLVSSSLLFLLPDFYHLNLWLSKIVATGFGIVVTFMGSRLWVFPEEQITRSEM
jgi:putative flippase GtrA